MKRQILGLGDVTREPGNQIPNGLFLVSTALRVQQYLAVVGLLRAMPGRWPRLLQLIRQHHSVFRSWETFLPAGLALGLLLVHTLATLGAWRAEDGRGGGRDGCSAGEGGVAEAAQKKCPAVDSLGVAQSPKSSLSGTVESYSTFPGYQEELLRFFVNCSRPTPGVISDS